MDSTGTRKNRTEAYLDDQRKQKLKELIAKTEAPSISEMIGSMIDYCHAVVFPVPVLENSTGIAVPVLQKSVPVLPDVSVPVQQHPLENNQENSTGTRNLTIPVRAVSTYEEILNQCDECKEALKNSCPSCQAQLIGLDEDNRCCSNPRCKHYDKQLADSIAG